MTTAARNSHCSWCGHRFDADAVWPRVCANCGQTSYLNPLPVAVVLVPVGGDGLLLVRRAIEPQRGKLALPGGFIALGETWQQAAARELREETNGVVSASDIADFYTRSAPDGTVLIFGLAPPISVLPPFAPNAEVSELVAARAPQPLAFPLHTDAMAAFFATRL